MFISIFPQSSQHIHSHHESKTQVGSLFTFAETTEWFRFVNGRKMKKVFFPLSEKGMRKAAKGKSWAKVTPWRRRAENMSELNSSNKNIFFYFRIMLKALWRNCFVEILTKSAGKNFSLGLAVLSKDNNLISCKNRKQRSKTKHYGKYFFHLFSLAVRSTP
jgi:hypothetical protein